MNTASPTSTGVVSLLSALHARGLPVVPVLPKIEGSMGLEEKTEFIEHCRAVSEIKLRNLFFKELKDNHFEHAYIARSILTERGIRISFN